MASFEALFRVSALHRLVLVKSRSRGGRLSGEYWEHEEYDGLGRLIARYHCYKEVEPSGQRRCGWRRYNPDSRVPVAEEPAFPEMIPF
jgi:hypothetical protein